MGDKGKPAQPRDQKYAAANERSPKPSRHGAKKVEKTREDRWR